MPPTTTMAAAAMLESLNPATGEVVGEVPVASLDEIPAVVARARAAQPGWESLGFDGRRAALLPASSRLLEEVDELARLLTREMGKPLKDARGEISGIASSLPETLDDIASALKPESFEDARFRSTVHFDPLGVCAAITPWNFPIAMPHWMVIPALMAGNTVVLKPSEETPLIAQRYVEILNESLPPNVLQVVHGRSAQGQALVKANVDIIAFTGSREAGKHILGAASDGLKRVILELGGKDPLIVLDDADLDEAAQFAVNNSFRNAGQVCVSTERIYVDEKVADAFQQKMIELTRNFVVGPGENDDTVVGPMINQRQRDHVRKQVDAAVKDGAQVLLHSGEDHDNFVYPTILTNVDHNMDIMREETFGPVACVMRFKSADEAAALANDTPFGLGAAVFGRDQQRTSQVARKLKAGMVGINKGCGGASGTPWVGAQQSGYGYHSGRDGHRQFTQPRVVSAAK